MQYSLKLLPIAYDDISNIIKFYDNNTGNTIIGDKVINSIDKKITNLKRNYNNYQIRYRNVRLVHLKKYNCSIHYIIDDQHKRIVIIAVFSMKENPEKWENRHKLTQS